MEAKVEENFTALLNNIYDPIWSIDCDYNFIIFNNSFSSQYFELNNTKAEVGKSALEFYTREQQNFWKTKYDIALSGVGVMFEYTIKIGKKEIIYEVSLNPIINNGRISGVSVTSRDISDRFLIEKTLKKSEENYKSIINSVSDAIYILDEKGKFIAANVGAEKMYGYAKEYFVGKTQEFICAPNRNDIDKVQRAMLAAYNGEEQRIIYWGLKKNGEIFPNDVRFFSSKYKGKKVVIIVAQDITEKKETENALLESEEIFANLASSSSTLIFIYQDEKIVFANKAFELLTGFSKNEITKMRFFDFVHPDQRERAHMRGLARQRGEDVPERYDIKVLKKDGSIAWVDFTVGKINWNGKNAAIGSAFNITKYKESQLKLKESEERYKLITNLTSDYFFTVSIDKNEKSTTTWMGGSYEEITGYTFEEYKKIGGWLATIHPDDIEKYKLAFEKSNNKDVVIQVRTIHKSGKIVWVRNSFSSIWDPVQKKVVGITGAVKDITEENRQQLIRQIQYNIANAIVNVKRTNELFSIVRTELLQLIDANNFFVAFYDEDKDLMTTVVDYDKDKIVSWQAEKSITGIVIESTKKLLIHKDEILSLIKSKKITLVGKIPEVWLGVPLYINSKVFGAIVVQSYNDPDAYDKSSIELLEIIASQLSLFIERDKAEKDAMRLSRAIVHSPVSVVITNVNGDIEYVNPMFEKVSGYAFEEVFGKNPRILKSDKQSKEFYNELWNTVLSGKDWHGEFQNRKKNGELFWESAIISPIENEKGAITHLIAIKEDITEKKQMVEEIIISKEQAIASEKIKTEFLAQMSHEIRSPLNVIMSFIELIKGELGSNLTPDMEDGFKSIESASSRIIRTIDLILNMTDLQIGSYVISLVEIDIVSMLKRVKSEYLKSANDKGLDLRLELQFNRKKITTDEYAVLQIISNLVDNAIKYSEAGYVSIVAKQDDKNGLIIKFTDTGIGIKKEFIPLIFRSFTQEEQGYSRSFDGNGLGMALVKNYCDVISADISVQSKKGKGTTFILEIPNLKK